MKSICIQFISFRYVGTTRERFLCDGFRYKTSGAVHTVNFLVYIYSSFDWNRPCKTLLQLHIFLVASMCLNVKLVLLPISLKLECDRYFCCTVSVSDNASYDMYRTLFEFVPARIIMFVSRFFVTDGLLFVRLYGGLLNISGWLGVFVL